MSAARRSLLTATAAGTLLGALWFVPSANATAEKPVEQRHRADTSMSTMSEHTRQISMTSTTGSASTSTRVSTTSTSTSTTATTTSATTTSDSAGDGTRLADTGSFDTTPYVVGGTLSLALGAAFVTYSLRRERLGF
ncbi:cell wall protein [Streptomyces sp. WI04-05B]|uniref:cell wall protein n=1 Tax=Streptomyces TaxID=1883 RepID=UPI0029B0D4AE|nr:MULTISPECIES: cell wall protein [unclassified Streptomyces]MDX2542376.1 cell wall protein [Streptomyces sp. WI04-05B]MDX2584208.1 cell wall protein [Streptomyces sp. WI04-05A]MDX3751084.1 cell wall protein [Streptomyces sp. AK08-02]